MIPLIVITHGGIGRELILASNTIFGDHQQDGPVDYIEISSTAGIDEIRDKISEKVKNYSLADGYKGTLILTDVVGGSSCNVCLPLVKTHKVAIVSGVNLYMVLSALKNRTNDSITLEDLKNRIIADGIKSIADVCAVFIK